MQHHPFTLEAVSTLPHDVADTLVERIRKRHMDHEPILEEGVRSDPLGAVDDLIRHHEVAGLDLLGETARGAERDDTPNAEFPQGGDVGAHGDLRRVEFVVRAVAREKGHGDRFAGRGRRVFEDRDGRRRRAPGCVDVQDGRFVEVWEVVETSAADHGDVDFA